MKYYLSIYIILLFSISCQKQVIYIPLIEKSGIIEEIKMINKSVITFIGYESESYEDMSSFIRLLEEQIQDLSPEQHIILSNYSTQSFENIGLVLKIAAEYGFETIGLTNMNYLKHSSNIPDHLYIVNDSADILDIHCSVSHKIIAIGGGDHIFDELIVIKNMKTIPIQFYISEMNRNKANIKALKQGLSKPTHYFGKANQLFFTS